MRRLGLALVLSAGLAVGSAAYGQAPAAQSVPADICLTNACSAPSATPRAVGPNREAIDKAIRAGNAIDVAESGGSEADIIAALRQQALTEPGAARFVDSIDAGGRVTVETSPDGQPTIRIRGEEGTPEFAVMRRGPR